MNKSNKVATPVDVIWAEIESLEKDRVVATRRVAEINRALIKAQAKLPTIGLPRRIEAVGGLMTVEAEVHGDLEGYVFEWEIPGQIKKRTTEPTIQLSTAGIAPGHYPITVTAIPKPPDAVSPGVEILEVLEVEQVVTTSIEEVNVVIDDELTAREPDSTAQAAPLQVATVPVEKSPAAKSPAAKSPAAKSRAPKSPVPQSRHR